MAVTVTFRDPHDAARLVDALVAQAFLCESNAPLRAARYRSIADDLGDAIDASAVPVLPVPDPLDTPAPVPPRGVPA